MDYSQQHLAVESFSYSWLTSLTSSSLDGLEEPIRPSPQTSYEATSKELDQNRLKSTTSLREAQSFNFDIPISQSPEALVHADELFSNGLIRPVFLKQSKIEASNYVESVPVVLSSSFSSTTVVPAIRLHCHGFGRWRKASVNILYKCFRYLKPLYHRVSSSTRKSRRVDDIDRRSWEVKSRNNSTQSSPGRSIAYSTEDLHDIESAIHEAVLHCKRSIDK